MIIKLLNKFLNSILNKILFKINLILLFIFSVYTIYNLNRDIIYSKKISKNYIYVEDLIDGKNAIFSKNSNKKDIIGQISDYQKNYEHILILQKFDFYTYEQCDRYFRGYMDTNKYPIINDDYYNGGTKWYEYAKDKFKQDNYIRKVASNDSNYYIIIKNNDSLIGPLTKAEFNKKRIELKISTNLMLMSEDEILVVLNIVFSIIFYLLLTECLLYWPIFIVCFIIRKLTKWLTKKYNI